MEEASVGCSIHPRGTMIKISTPLIEIKRVGPRFLQKFKKLNIETVKDLVYSFPSRYEDFSDIVKIVDLAINQQATIQGTIQAVKVKRTWKRKMFIVEALVSDDTGSIKAIWFNARFLLSIIKKGKIVNLAGKVASDPESGLCLTHPVYEIINQQQIADEKIIETKHTGRIVPVYPETKGLTSKGIRYLLKPILDNLEKLPEILPKEIIKKYNFPEINSALKNIHFPDDIESAKTAKKRFAYEDLLMLSFINLTARLRLNRQKAYQVKIDLDFVKNLLLKLPFELTFSQKKSLWEILKDMEQSRPMNRLLQGDVGSGKTIVAAIAALSAAREGKQSAFMAPTEILARQHYFTFQKFFKEFNCGIGLITSKEARIFYGDGLENGIKKPEFIKKIQTGEIKIIIGTHSLIQKNILFNNLAFVVIDEQHRFGVNQRAELLRNSNQISEKILPHFLSMSATPIPRTLTLTIFGDLDLSIIDELPKNRKLIITKIVASANRDKAYAFIRGQVKKGRQAFVICPRIELTEEDQKLTAQNIINIWDNVKMVKEEYEKLSKNIFPDLKVGMLHGRMKAKEKNEIMGNFKNGKIDILVSTSVVEVGVDIPNTAIMMIESADKFGLSQLYQFRGRVGRGEHQSFCFLFTDSSSKFVYKRLNSLIEAKNGFELAEKDLEIRGPGEFLRSAIGWAQTGDPDISMKALQNPALVKSSREDAQNILKSDSDLKNYPLLKEKLNTFQKEVHLE